MRLLPAACRCRRLLLLRGCRRRRASVAWGGASPTPLGCLLRGYPCLPAACRRCTGHTNIVQLIEVFLTPRYLAIVLEYAPGGDLLDYVNAKHKLSGAARRLQGGVQQRQWPRRACGPPR